MASARLRQLGMTPAAMIALGGGLLAAGALGLAGLVAGVLARPEVTAEPAVVHALYYLVFLTGGTGHIVALGLLLTAMAVPSLVLGLLPRPVAWAGLVLAAIAELTTLVLVWPAVAPLLPIARLGGLVWLIVAGALLPTSRAP
ncbi:hypothetical protein BKN37_25250 [Mycobacterium talmoniae]|uniref:DUF4386 domain-containing protein n=2 Tax=Mycobacterium talmoniae TaxID=1858794 RepID=A0A1S1MYY6_9MYCO|nr:hypothetical protein BKN37_25250 [Mycobacterium talmoniae]TDH46957.1 hypothetical protein E2F47_26825 [Mycobacterium eburneum]